LPQSKAQSEGASFFFFFFFFFFVTLEYARICDPRV